jgi:putative solute:sodium symporter small subunit
MENNDDSSSLRRAYWRANTALIRNLLIVWALVSLVFSILLVQPLNAIQFGSVPLGFWMAQQGSIYVFVALIFVYAVQMDRLDRHYGHAAVHDQVVRCASVSNQPLPNDSNTEA